MRTPTILGCLLTVALCGSSTHAHEPTQRAFQKARRAARARALALAEDPRDTKTERPICKLTLDLVDAQTQKSLPGLVRITNAASGKAIRLSEAIERDMNWYAIDERPVLTVPKIKLKVEAVRGLETELCVREIDLTGKNEASLALPLRRFYNAAERGLRAGNTHLHLKDLTYDQADRYLRVVPRADALDLVYLSYLRRVPDERTYISNEIVANSFAGGELARRSRDGVLFANGEEHRHNFAGFGQGYGHVMFLDLVKLIRPVSIGPGIMREGTDGLPLQRGIREARRDGAAVIWCHNKFGLEDIPNWMAGLLDAQNINDGGPHGSYEDTYYRYLNLGLKVPFSTGTDWFIYDFSRVYVPIEGELTSKKWLAALAAGKSTITNGPLLELQAAGRDVGDTIVLSEPGTVEVKARGVGRSDFHALELVHNGQVIATIHCHATEGHFLAELKFTLQVREPGWLAVRVPADAGRNEFDKPIYAHTSPIYIELAGQHIFRPEVAEELIAEMEANIETIKKQGKFADAAELEAVLKVHREGIEILRKRLQARR